MSNLPTFSFSDLPAGTVFAFRPTLRGAARLSTINRLTRAYHAALAARDAAHDRNHGWDAAHRTVSAIVANGPTRERSTVRAKSIRQRSHRNAAERRNAARANPNNVACCQGAEKATLAYMAQAFRYRVVRLMATA